MACLNAREAGLLVPCVTSVPGLARWSVLFSAGVCPVSEGAFHAHQPHGGKDWKRHPSRDGKQLSDSLRVGREERGRLVPKAVEEEEVTFVVMEEFCILMAVLVNESTAVRENGTELYTHIVPLCLVRFLVLLL